MTAQIDPFRAIAISRQAHAMKAAGHKVIHMEFGQPSTGAPSKAIEVAHAILDTDAMGYWESSPLKQALAGRYLDLHGVRLDPERIVLTCGASPALVLGLNAAFAPGDVIAFASPGYVAYRNTVKALHLTPMEIRCDATTRFQISAAQIAALDPAPQGLILASPANPTGTIIPADELAAIASVCARRGIRIVSDEIYHGLSFVGPTHSALEFAPNALVVNSFSKYFSMAGWRLGWLVAPDDLVDAARARMGNLFLTAPALAQHAGLAAMSCLDELEGHVATYRANRDLLLQALPNMGLTRFAPPDGAFYIYVDVSHLTDNSMAFAQTLLADTGVAIAPGVDFDPHDGHTHLRMSFAVSTPEIVEAIARLTPWFSKRSALR
ncbi:aspartate aminotransferase [Candidatus Phycosocius bacilliformis]|uniref:Aminotransferase n=1 Tax=Candidatus Phycosocius bacilliformis TaxID=1445552 RepID=A0A2P2EAN9_9PROT|nr:aminotransferase class I/II-fold pyridoxal phosphate-dependent enzyme [Candidatus Phycosocius bacilliformis]GBF58148.1 aspartate aminotransferase [Candidatus Phycosocius bacilliformis]